MINIDTTSKWFRWWHGSLNDPKFQTVAKISRQPFPTVVALWVALLEHASSVTHCNADVTRGSLKGFDVTDFDTLFRVDDGTCAAIYAGLEEKGLIEDGSIASWEKRQVKREDDPSKDRVAEHRARKKLEEVLEKMASLEAENNELKRAVTQGNARGEKKRKDKSKPPTNTLINELNSLAPATRLPNDWKLPAKYGLWAKDYDPGWTDDYIRELGESFKDFWTPLPDNRFAKKTDWFATWRNFLRQRVPASKDAKGKPTRGRNWYDTEQGIRDKAAAEGVTIADIDTWPRVIEKIIAKMEKNDRKGEAIPAAEPQKQLSVPLMPDQPQISPEEAKQAREAALALVKDGKRQRRGSGSSPQEPAAA